MTLGQTLGDARRAAGLALDEVSQRTRVRVAILRAMEDDDFSTCGGEFYARANLREFARVIAVPAAPLLAQYDRDHGGGEPSSSPVFEPDAVPRPDGRGINWSAAMALALVVVAALGIGNLVLRGKESPGTATTTVNEALGATASATPSSPSPSASASTGRAPATSSPASSLVAQAPRDSVTVVLAAVSGKSWVSATSAAGRQLFQGVLSPGESQTLVDKTKIRLRIGNAGGVELTVNGHRLGSPGGVGQVTTVEFTPQDPAAG